MVGFVIFCDNWRVQEDVVVKYAIDFAAALKVFNFVLEHLRLVFLQIKDFLLKKFDAVVCLVEEGGVHVDAKCGQTGLFKKLSVVKYYNGVFWQLQQKLRLLWIDQVLVLAHNNVCMRNHFVGKSNWTHLFCLCNFIPLLNRIDSLWNLIFIYIC